MPRKTRSPATETVSFKITAKEKRGLRRLLRQNQAGVRELTGRNNISGLMRLMVFHALDTRVGTLFIARNPPFTGPRLDVTGIKEQELLDKTQELFRREEEQEDQLDHETWWAETFPDWDIDKNPFE